jgi:hypothetical protein
MSARLLVLVGVCTVGMASAASAVTIVSPRPGAVVTAGSSVLVVVEPGGDEVLSQVVVTTASGTALATPLQTPATNPPNRFQATVQIPLEAVGPEFVVALAKRSDGTFRTAVVQVTVDAGAIEALFLDAPPMLDRSGQIVQLSVRGRFTDGVVRDLTASDRGTTYATSDSRVVAVNADGLAQARSGGYSDLTVTNRGLTASAAVGVEIAAPTGIPTADSGADLAVSAGQSVVLDGSRSSDPDGDPLTYHWEQRSGPEPQIADTESAALAFTAPDVTAVTVLEFALTVVDDKKASSLPAVVRVTVNPR